MPSLTSPTERLGFERIDDNEDTGDARLRGLQATQLYDQEEQATQSRADRVQEVLPVV
jgi:hypothetical protein